MPREAGFGVEEIECLVNAQSLKGILVVVPFVVVAVNGVAYVAVLQVGVDVHSTAYAVVGLHVYIGIVLCGIVAVVFVFGGKVSHIILYPQHLPEVSAVISVRPTSQCGIYLSVPVCQREDSSAKMVVHGLFAYKVAPAYIVAVSSVGL